MYDSPSMITLLIYFKNDYMKMSISTKNTLSFLKQQLSNVLEVPVNELLLSFNNRFLTEDKKTIEELKIKENDIIILKKRNLKIEPGQKNDTKDILNNPMLKNIVKDKKLMKQMVKSIIPEKEIKKNEQLKNIMNNPHTIDEMEKIINNPDYYDQQLKNIDLAMSKLENIPGGFNMMHSLTREIRDPFSQIMEGSGVNLKGISQNDLKSKQDEILPNIWQKKTNNFNSQGFYGFPSYNHV
ncbi:ubiquitin-like protein, partial [Pseudoloma neurophilia]